VCASGEGTGCGNSPLGVNGVDGAGWRAPEMNRASRWWCSVWFAGDTSAIRGILKRFVNDHHRSCSSGKADSASFGTGSIHANRAVAAIAPRNCTPINPVTSAGRIPENVLVMDRARVTAGLAKDVDAVNQYAAVM
jgi:hypothetical protein